MGIIDSILRRHDYGGGYRTVDGGHPAPYPDMTDEQLYNYEIAFNVQRRTFERRPAAPAAATAAAVEPAARAATEKVLDSARFSARRAARRAPPDATSTQARPGAQTRSSTSEPEPEHQPQPKVEPEPAPTAGSLDWSKPVRLVTTRQPVEILTTRARHPIFKVHGYIGDATVATVFTLDGRLSENGPCFLENVPERRQLFLNVYPEPAAGQAYRITQHASRELADADASADRLACVAVELEGAPPPVPAPATCPASNR